MKKIKYLAGIIMCAMTLIVMGCSKVELPDEIIYPEVETPEQLPIVTMVIKDYGTIEAQLYPQIAPNTVYNFISLIEKGFYDGLTIHRVDKGFVLQGGDPTGIGSGGPGYQIVGEFAANGIGNDLKHTEGVLSMARSQSKNSGGSQFFIMTKDSPHLDGSYASFGKVIKGMDIVHNIENTETLPGDRPSEDVIIESIKVDTKGENYPKPNKL